MGIMARLIKIIQEIAVSYPRAKIRGGQNPSLRDCDRKNPSNAIKPRCVESESVWRHVHSPCQPALSRESRSRSFVEGLSDILVVVARLVDGIRAWKAGSLLARCSNGIHTGFGATVMDERSSSSPQFW
jgi:hypothetical protein